MDDELKIMGEVQESLSRLPDDEARVRVSEYFTQRYVDRINAESDDTDSEELLSDLIME